MNLWKLSVFFFFVLTRLLLFFFLKKTRLLLFVYIFNTVSIFVYFCGTVSFYFLLLRYVFMVFLLLRYFFPFVYFCGKFPLFICMLWKQGWIDFTIVCLLLQYVYHTVGIEGNTMSLAQTRSILETKLAVAGAFIVIIYTGIIQSINRFSFLI